MDLTVYVKPSSYYSDWHRKALTTLSFLWSQDRIDVHIALAPSTMCRTARMSLALHSTVNSNESLQLLPLLPVSIRRNRSYSTILPIATHFLITWSVCLLCTLLNRWTDLDVIWQVHLWGPMTYCVRWGLRPPWKREIRATPQQLQIAAATCRIRTRNDSNVFQIILVLV